MCALQSCTTGLKTSGHDACLCSVIIGGGELELVQWSGSVSLAVVGVLLQRPALPYSVCTKKSNASCENNGGAAERWGCSFQMTVVRKALRFDHWLFLLTHIFTISQASIFLIQSNRPVVKANQKHKILNRMCCHGTWCLMYVACFLHYTLAIMSVFTWS